MTKEDTKQRNMISKIDDYTRKLFFQICCIPFDGGDIFSSAGAIVGFRTSGSGFFTNSGSLNKSKP